MRRRNVAKKLGDIATQVLFENEKVKIWHLIVESGQASSWHLHERDYVTVPLEGGGLSVEYGDGTGEDADPRPKEWVYHGDHRVHRVVNNTDRRYKSLLIELKR